MKWIAIKNISKLPSQTGVYLLAGPKEILYIGKAVNIKNRVKTHFQRPTFRDTLFLNQIKKIGYLVTNSEIGALLLESQLIKKYQPKYNIMWKDDKKYFYVVFTKEKLPRILLTHQPIESTSKKLKVGTCIGPFVDGKALKHTLRLLRRIFPYYTQSKHPLVPCSWCHLGLCPGPNPNVRQYKKNIRAIKNILRGKKDSLLNKLKKEMLSASKKQQYEKAAQLRNQIQNLISVIENAKIIYLATEIPQNQKPNWLETQKQLKNILKIKKNIHRIEAYDISDIQGQQATGSMVVFIDGKPDKKSYRKFKIKLAEQPNDTAMISEVIERRLSHLEWPLPEVMLIDGGKGQLNSAIKARNKSLKNKKIKIIALAKKQNQLFIEGSKEPIWLKDCPADIANLILHLRDEAHRFAKTYHQKLREIDIKNR